MNPDSPIFPLVQRVKGQLEALYGERLAGLYLYGSHARGEARTDSDIDLLAVLSGRVTSWEEIDKLVDATYDLELESDELISVYPVASERYEMFDSPLFRNIRREGISV